MRLTIHPSHLILDPSLEVWKQDLFPRIGTLLIGDIESVDSAVDFIEMLIASDTINPLLDLGGVELDVVEDRSVRGKGAEDAIVAKVQYAVVVRLQAGRKL